MIKKNSEFGYFHVDQDFDDKVKTKYEFDWVSTDRQVKFSRSIEPMKIDKIDFLKIIGELGEEGVVFNPSFNTEQFSLNSLTDKLTKLFI